MPVDWFSPEVAPMFAFLSLTAVVSSVDHYSRRGEHRPLVTGVYTATSVFGAALLAAGVIAMVAGQRWHVVFPLGFAGATILLAGLWSLLSLKRVYSESELRRSLAKDL